MLLGYHGTARFHPAKSAAQPMNDAMYTAHRITAAIHDRDPYPCRASRNATHAGAPRKSAALGLTDAWNSRPEIASIALSTNAMPTTRMNTVVRGIR